MYLDSLRNTIDLAITQFLLLENDENHLTNLSFSKTELLHIMLHL
jgi:hypothetical protein